MPWDRLLFAGVLLVVGTAIMLNAESLAKNIHDAQRNNMGPWSRPDDQIERPGLLGQNSDRARTLSMRGVGIVAIVAAVVVIVGSLVGAF